MSQTYFCPLRTLRQYVVSIFAIVLININSDNITDIYIILDNLIVIIDITFPFNIDNNIILTIIMVIIIVIIIIMVDINTLFFQSAVSGCHG